jgi:hypothetical protein
MPQPAVRWSRNLAQKLFENRAAGIEKLKKRFSGFARVLNGQASELFVKKLSRLQTA